MDTRIKNSYQLPTSYKRSVLLLMSILLLSTTLVSAKFICGQVQQTDQLFPSWYEVQASLKENKTISTTCQISPSELKYCCDIASLKEIYNYTWKPQDIFQVKITDPASGYFAPKKEVLLTGNDYDIPPKLEIKKAIETFPKIQKIYTSPSDIILISSNECLVKNSTFEVSAGKNILFYQTICNDQTFSLKETFYVLEKLEIKKDPSTINSNEEKEFKIKISSKTFLEDIKIKEYIPSNFKILEASNNGQIKKSTKDYNVIEWNFNGNEFEQTYKLKAPEISIIPRTYEIITDLEEETISKSTLKVQNTLPLPSIKEKSNNYKYTPETFSKISQTNPIISKNKNTTLTLYSNQTSNSESFTFKEFTPKIPISRNYKTLTAYEIISSLSIEEQKELRIIHEIPRTFLQEKDFKDLAFFGKNNENLFQLNSTKTFQGEKIRYEITSSPIEELYILAEKNSLSIIDKILNFLEKLKFW